MLLLTNSYELQLILSDYDTHNNKSLTFIRYFKWESIVKGTPKLYILFLLHLL